MAIFITYARKDRAGVEALRQDLERSHNAVWMDNELTGGQSWWDAILGQIRACDLYVFALSPESLKSRACVSELDYALAVGRPLLPVRRSHPQTATIMVLACLGVVTCAITSIISLVMAASAIKEIDANPGAYGNRQTITMARVIAIISIVAVVFLFILYLQIPPSS
jgi:hypothetical protein